MSREKQSRGGRPFTGLLRSARNDGSTVIARSEVTKQSRRGRPSTGLLRYARNDAWFTRNDRLVPSVTRGRCGGLTYNPQRPVSGFRPGRGTPTACFGNASIHGRLGYAHKTMRRMVLSR
ncbi:MAG: hypothetical protein LBT00_00320 [Spirochaetaceae bacterium]|nr:hypothetical protein [Spirochaetaceae bacterium]